MVETIIFQILPSRSLFTPTLAQPFHAYLGAAFSRLPWGSLFTPTLTQPFHEAEKESVLVGSVAIISTSGNLNAPAERALGERKSCNSRIPRGAWAYDRDEYTCENETSFYT